MIIRKASDIQKAIDQLNTGLYTTYDIETSGLSVRKDKIIGFGCCNPDTLQAFYIVMKEWNGAELVDVLSDSDVLPVIQLLQKRRIIGWNLSFDLRFTRSYFNVNLFENAYHDGMLALHTLDENRMNYKLKEYAAEVFGSFAVSEQSDMLQSIKDNGGTEKEYFKADSTLMAKYGLQDNILTAKIYNMQKKELESQKLAAFFYVDEVMPLLKHVTLDMEYRGVPVDTKYMQQTLEEITVDMEKIHNDIQAAIAPLLTEFNAWYLNNKFPVKLSGEFLNTLSSLIAPADWPVTKAGGYSFSAAAFKKKPHLLDSDLWQIHEGKKRLTAEQISAVQTRMFENSGVKHAFNILSKDHLKRLLFDKLKETPLSFTDKGNPQVSDDLLDVLAAKYDWVRQLRIYNKLVKIKSTYVERFLEKQEDGIFYPSYFMHRTDSGRFSGDFQQLNRPYEQEQLDKGEVDPVVFKYNNRIREFFISAPNHTFVDLDYDSQEVKVFAHVSGEEQIKDIFRKGLDFYSYICIIVEGLTEYSADKKASNYLGKKNKAARQRAKAYALGLAFNMSPYALSKTLDISESEAQIIYNNYFKNFPALKAWVEDSKIKAKRDGLIITEAGRHRRLTKLKESVEKYGEVLFDSLELWKEYNDSPRQYTHMKEVSRECRSLLNVSVNVQVQSLAASITNRSAVACAKKYKELGMNSKIAAVLHDEILVHAPDNEVQQASDILESSMMNTYKISVPLPAPPSYGKTYRESKG